MVMKVSSTPTYSDTVLPVEPRYIVLLNIIKKGAVCQPNNSNKSIIIIIHADSCMQSYVSVVYHYSTT